LLASLIDSTDKEVDVEIKTPLIGGFNESQVEDDEIEVCNAQCYLPIEVTSVVENLFVVFLLAELLLDV